MSVCRYIIGDTRDVLATLPDDSVDMVMTSPPFLALRSYLPADHPDKHREIGSEPSPAEFLDTLLALTADWERVLAPHGSICVELGDTYSGSGGAGGDYNAGGLRDGQQAFSGSAAKRAKLGVGDDYRPDRSGRDASDWPLAKSICGIPWLYSLSLAYGRNLLTGEPSPAGMWRVRNVVAWCRPNPPVGALGDKFRPATSYLTIATKAGDRYFDLDAVRYPANPDNRRPSALKREGIGGRVDQVCNPLDDDGQRVIANAAGAPPLDWWEIPTSPYKGSHYAVFPPALIERPIKSMCPHQVCTVCGEPRRRIVEVAGEVPVRGPRERDRQGRGRSKERLGLGATGQQHTETRTVETIGWTDCGHDSWRNGVVLDPFGGSGTTGMVATGMGRDAVLIDLDERNADLARDRVGMFLDVEHLELAPEHCPECNPPTGGTNGD